MGPILGAGESGRIAHRNKGLTMQRFPSAGRMQLASRFKDKGLEFKGFSGHHFFNRGLRFRFIGFAGVLG